VYAIEVRTVPEGSKKQFSAARIDPWRYGGVNSASAEKGTRLRLLCMLNNRKGNDGKKNQVKGSKFAPAARNWPVRRLARHRRVVGLTDE
jgi:hypothetical protein